MKRVTLIMVTTLFIIFTIHFLCYANDNIIYGCYKKNGGELRIVKDWRRCLPSELPISWNQAGHGSSMDIRRMEPSPCSADGYGWCPDGFSRWMFYIKDSAVNEGSVIALNVVNPSPGVYEVYGCEVEMKWNGVFRIICPYGTGQGTILQYAVFNP